jgi:hypothetical protein
LVVNSLQPVSDEHQLFPLGRAIQTFGVSAPVSAVPLIEVPTKPVSTVAAVGVARA